MSTSHQAEHAGGHPTFKQYALVAVILFVVTIVEFLLIWDRVGISDDLGASKVPILIVLSAFKFAIVIMFYMHLKFDGRLFSGVFLTGLGLAFAAGIALVGLFVGFEGTPREFAEANRAHYSEEEAHATADEGATSGESARAAAANLTIGPVGDTLAFDIPEFEVKANTEITLTFTNPSVIFQHNWVLVEAGAKDAVALDGIAAGPENDYVPPDDPRVLANTRLLSTGESQEISFTLPAGTYTFACTFPGHNAVMFGDFVVTP